MQVFLINNFMLVAVAKLLLGLPSIDKMLLFYRACLAMSKREPHSM